MEHQKFLTTVLLVAMNRGGINYKDLNVQIKALNVKFITNLNVCRSHHTILPSYWISKYFEKLANIKNEDLQYYRDFCSNELSIINQCYFKTPKKRNWNGHPFYFASLEALSSLTGDLPNVKKKSRIVRRRHKFLIPRNWDQKV